MASWQEAASEARQARQGPEVTKADYWKAHVKKHPSFANENKRIEMSIGALKELMFEAYDKGFDHHAKRVDEVHAQMRERLNKKSGLSSIVDDIFGGLGLR